MIRIAERDDISNIAKLNHAAINGELKRGELSGIWRTALNDPKNTVYVHENNGNISGVLHTRTSNEQRRIVDQFVAASKKGSGIESLLIQEALNDQTAPIVVCMLKKDKKTMGLYTSVGFIVLPQSDRLNGNMQEMIWTPPQV